MVIRQIINNVKQKGICDNALWAYPIAYELQKHSYKLVVKWVVKCVQIYLSNFKPLNLARLSKYVEQVLTSENILTPIQCDEMGKKIWYSSERDCVQSAIAYIWWMIAQFKLEEDYSGIMEATMAVGLLLPDISDNNLLNKYLEAAVDIIEEYK